MSFHSASSARGAAASTWRCVQCTQVFGVEQEAGAVGGMEDSAMLEESWLDVSASTIGAGSPVKGTPCSGAHAQLDQRRKIRELASELIAPTHPLCEGCTEKLMAELKAARDQAEKERRIYTAELDRLNKELGDKAGGIGGGGGEVARRAEADDAEEEALVATLAALEGEKGGLRRKMGELELRAGALDEERDRYWREYNDLQIRLRASDRESLRRKIEATALQLEALNTTNVLNDAFHISHTDVFGTINGFRLGSVTSQPVEWDEINAAWGQTALLLQTLASNSDFTFPTYRVVPLGSFSRIIRRDDDRQVMDLFCQSDIGISRLFGYGSFDKGMAAFIDCVRALQDHVRSQDPSFSPPYRIADHKIEELSVKLQFNTYDKWTKALKYMLTNIKWLVASSLSRRA